MWIPGGLASFYDKISDGRRSRFVLSFDRNELLTYFFRQMKGNLSGISKTLYFFIIRIIQNFIIHTNKISFNQNNFHSRYILSNVTNFTLIHQFADAEGPGRVFSVMEFILKSLRLYQPLFPLWAFQWQFIAEILAGPEFCPGICLSRPNILSAGIVLQYFMPPERFLAIYAFCKSKKISHWSILMSIHSHLYLKSRLGPEFWPEISLSRSNILSAGIGLPWFMTPEWFLAIYIFLKFKKYQIGPIWCPFIAIYT